MRSPHLAAMLFATLCLGATGCAFGSYLFESEQETLMKTLMRDLDAAQKQLDDSAEKGRWDAVVRISGEMAEKARRLQTIEPRKDVSDFRIRSIELEHDLGLVAGEAGHENSAAVDMHLKNLDFTCKSCHRKFQTGRPW